MAAKAARKPRNLKVARECRYCGHVSTEMVREDRANHYHAAAYSCRDVDACGGRIRAVTGHVLGQDIPGSLPF